MRLLQHIINTPPKQFIKCTSTLQMLESVSTFGLRVLVEFTGAAASRRLRLTAPPHSILDSLLLLAPHDSSSKMRPENLWAYAIRAFLAIFTDPFNLETSCAAEHSKFAGSAIQLIPDSRCAPLPGKDEHTNSLAPCSRLRIDYSGIHANM